MNAACINTPGSFTCQCFLGYTGNGKVCIADVPAQQAIADKFKTDGTGGQQWLQLRTVRQVRLHTIKAPILVASECILPALSHSPAAAPPSLLQ